jgi:hypothetical protein
VCQKWQPAARLFWYSSLEELAAMSAKVPVEGGGVLARTDMQCTGAAVSSTGIWQGAIECTWQSTSAQVEPALLQWVKPPPWAYSGAAAPAEAQVYLAGPGRPALGMYATSGGTSAAVLCRA